MPRPSSWKLLVDETLWRAGVADLDPRAVADGPDCNCIIMNDFKQLRLVDDEPREPEPRRAHALKERAVLGSGR